ncbi:MAG: MOSC domain-containing protein [Acidobacteria bacterium]|nr:MOSC domain-containing protein [Acidobacteriota bacterium]MBU4307144.1 MOSC domain-containing protein [Acidobacteriota bacterium]MBU4405470.1 MOSC domain-containing protein [Acidobacteriota bacterium]MCG2812666.1 MOSC domain-containing protein [Candidatus Aminicenantes bacterium]
MKFKVESVNIAAVKGVQKHEVLEIVCRENFGIEGDAHAGAWHRQVSLLAGEAVDAMKAKGLDLGPGAFGENIVTRGVDWSRAKVGKRITIGVVELQITQIGKECHSRCAIYYAAGECIMPSQGIFAKVLKGGKIHAQSSGDYRIR